MLKDKCVFITGGGTGIGRFIAKGCAAAGAKVVVAGRRREPIKSVAKEVGGRAVELDVREPDSVRAAVESAGRIDVLVNNAAGFARGNVVDLPVEDWDRVIGTNLRGVFLMCKAVLPQMIERKDGDVVMVSSTSGRRGNAGATAYTASKHALNGFTDALLKEVRPFNIRVISVSPSAVETPERTDMRETRLQAGDVAEAVVAALQLPGRALVRDVELWATNPWQE